MSASKNKAIDKLNEAPVKKLAPKKARPPRPKREAAAAIEKVEQMATNPVLTDEQLLRFAKAIANQNPPDTTEEIEQPKPVAVEPEQNRLIVSPIINPSNAFTASSTTYTASPAIEVTNGESVPHPVIEQYKEESTKYEVRDDQIAYPFTREQIEQFLDAQPKDHPEPEPEKETVWQRWKRTGLIWWIGCGLLFLIGLIIYIAVQKNKDRKADKKTEQVEAKIETGKERLEQTRSEITERHRIVDSTLEADALRFNKALLEYKEFHATMDSNNAQYKKENYDIQTKIHDPSFSNDDRRKLSRELSEEK